MTPLHIAAYDGRLALIKLLLERGANRDAKSDHGTTPVDVVGNNTSTDIAVKASVRELLRTWQSAKQL
jgi:ankyrin repeat protein